MARTTAASCSAGTTTLCLNNQRFKVDVRWKDFDGKTGVGQAVPLTSDTGYFWFFGSSNVELVVKVLDGRGLNRHFWVFFGALSNVEYTMTVTDSETGTVKTYFNPSGRFASVGDTEAFASAGIATHALNAVTPVPHAVSSCAPNDTSLCMNGGRFRVEVNWKDFSGNSGTGKAVPLTADTGYFWFFGSENVELVVKILDARGLNNKFWVFYGALSSVQYEMTVTDTLTGNVKIYTNAAGQFASVGDTDGFLAGYNVSAHLDDARAASLEMPAAGGSLSATAADGTVFTLTVPPGALASGETITLTPVAAIDQLPLSGGLSAAVQLAPEGLRLLKSATLSINPTAAIPIDEEVTFAWRGSGEEFILYPPNPAGTRAISLSVTHLGGYGVGRGTPADQAAQQQRRPGSTEDFFNQRLQSPAAAQRRELRQAAGAKTAGQIEATKILTEYLNDEIFPKEPQNCEKKTLKDFVFKVKWFRENVRIFTGPDAALVAAGDQYLDVAIRHLKACYDGAFEQCTDFKDPTQVERMAWIWLTLASEGKESSVDSKKIQRCLTFELTFDSVIEELQPQGAAFAFRHQVHAVVPLTLSSFEDGPVGNGDLKYASLTYSGPSISPCSQTTVGGNSVFQVIKTSLDFNVFDGGPPPEPLTMEYDPGYPNFKFTVTCPMAPEIVLDQQRWRAEYYDHFHSDERSGSGFIAKGWQRIGGDVYARKTYQRPSPFAVETTTLTLKHTPK
ncbi:MAG: hypothetical protein M3041_00475 [Acidobacteriota bacterium]|nr:hypothetical protein [Acidobacteriota bacterium]